VELSFSAAGRGAIGFFLIATTLAAATREEADRLAGTPPGGVAGRVMQAGGAPLAGAKVTLHRGEETRSALTDEKGDYCFCSLSPSGGYVLEIEMEGSSGWIERDIRVSRAKIVVRNVILEPLSRYHIPSGDSATP
jgi:hypothetical protein